jgi:hypothetical protein
MQRQTEWFYNKARACHNEIVTKWHSGKELATFNDELISKSLWPPNGRINQL